MRLSYFCEEQILAAWLTLDEALHQVLSHVVSINETQILSIDEAFGHVLAESLYSPLDVPPWNNSAMDGYALNLENEHAENLTLTITQTIKAGELSELTLNGKECARIMTGAPIPPGANTVVMQENVERTGSKIQISGRITRGDNIRPKAGDIAKNQRLFEKGHRLRAQDLMLLSSVGIHKMCVFRAPKVAIVATGDELVAVTDTPDEKQIYESHRVGLRAKLKALHCEVTDAGILKDDQATITQTFASLAASHDLVISSGGVSVGDADWVKPALQRLGDLHLWKIAIKPGKPFAFGQFGACLFCGLPGNPVSAFVTFEQLVVPLLHKLAGESSNNEFVIQKPLNVKATLTTSIKRRAGRVEFARGRFIQNEAGELSVSLLPKQSSSVMTSLTHANCYIVIPAESEGLSENTVVTIQPFSLLI